MIWQVKMDGCEPMRIVAKTADEALRSVVHGYTMRHYPVEGDIERRRDGGLLASVWSTGKQYVVKPMPRAENPKSQIPNPKKRA